MKYFFEDFLEFIDFDSRKVRTAVPVTAETLTKRHQITLPQSLIKDASILDLGSCLGASGHWCLSNGARHYTGVEVQQGMVDKSNNIMSKYWSKDQYEIVHQDLTEFLTTTTQTFDIVLMFGVIYAFVDTYTILKNVSKICNKSIIIDSGYPRGMTTNDSAILYISKFCQINSDNDGIAFEGVGIRPSPEGLRLLLGTLGFVDKENILYPEPPSDASLHDAYNTPMVRAGSNLHRPARFILRFTKTEDTIRLLKDAVVNNDSNSKVPMFTSPGGPEIASSGERWLFDDSVASRFQDEASKHIPDYDRVIKLCQQYVEKVFMDNKEIKILDVGSALGYTMEKFITSGYSNVYGVESSNSMLSHSKYPERTILSNTMPVDKWNVVLANWTLHFVQEREQYIQNVYDNLEEGGLFIVSDKMSYSQETEDLYYSFKQSNGVSKEDILKKKHALQGVLVSKPLTWYLETLEKIGFVNVQVINANLMFHTIYARKR